MSRAFNRLLRQTLVQRSSIHGSVRLYGRWMHRSPAKVLLPIDTSDKGTLKKEKIIDLDPAILNRNKNNEKEPIRSENHEVNSHTQPNSMSLEKSKQIKQRKEENLKRQKLYLSQQKVFDDNGNIIYEKLNENDARVSSLLVKLKSKKERSRTSQTLVEGWRLIVDGLEAKCLLKYVIFSRTTDLDKLRPFLPKTGVRFYKIPYKEIQLWSDVETSPGIFGVFEIPATENLRSQSRPLPLQIVCDNIRVPGNMGAILRVAVAVGCEKVLLSKGCVDVWDPKVIRSAAGAHFRLPIHQSIEWIDMPSHLDPNTSVFIADSNAISDVTNEDDNKSQQIQMPVLPYYGIEFSSLKHITLILGGETEGISEDSYLLAASKNGLRLNIPIQRGVDSLNTGMAIAVIAFEVRKQLIRAWTKQKLERKMAEVSSI